MASGSCCMAGKRQFRNCGTFWYSCPGAVRNNFTMLQLGSSLTLLAGTVHAAYCEPREERILCRDDVLPAMPKTQWL